MADEQVLGMHYFDHQFLRQADFETAQNYHVDRLRQHNRLLHLPGIVEGLLVTGTINTRVVQVTLGRAVDETHHEVILRRTADPEVSPLLRVQTGTGFQESEQHITGTALTIDLTSVPASPPPDNAVFITVRQGTKETNRSQDPGTTDNNTRLVERPIIEASTSAPIEAQLLLAQINRNADGTIQNVDLTERVLAGAWLADGSVTRPKLAHDVVTSVHIAEADGTSDQDTNTGTGVKTGHLQDQAVTSDKIADDTIQLGNLHPDLRSIIESGGVGDDAIQSAMIAEADQTSDQDTNTGTGVKTGHLQDQAVTSDKIADNAVTNEKIADDAVTNEKIADSTLFYTKLNGTPGLDGEFTVRTNTPRAFTVGPANAFVFVSVTETLPPTSGATVQWWCAGIDDRQVAVVEALKATAGQEVKVRIRSYILTEPS